jgi:hypothetical protein
MYCEDTYQRVRRMAREQARLQARKLAVANAGSPCGVGDSRMRLEPAAWALAARPVVVGDVGATGRFSPALVYYTEYNLAA